MRPLSSQKNLFKAVGYFMVALVIAGGCIYVVYFMYNNVYKTFVYTDEVLSVNESQGGYRFDMEEFNEIGSSLEEKRQERELDVFMDFN